MIDLEIKLQKGGFLLDAAFRLPDSGVHALFGASGCGKTTLLRCLAGLEPAVSGSIRFKDQVWLSSGKRLATHRRKIGYVFQGPSLFPHLSVYENLLFGAKRRGVMDDAKKDEIVTLTGLRDLLERGTSQLSGGEMQRVAIGRALMSSPQLLLLDEPLSALDVSSKSKLLPFLEKVLQHLEIPAFYVSHSPDEVARLADNLVLMEKGRVTAYGSLAELVSRPDSALAVADDAFTVLHCTVLEKQIDGLTTLQSKGGAVLQITGTQREPGSVVKLRIQARDVSLCIDRSEKTSILNVLPAQVDAISSRVIAGNRTVKLKLAGEDLLARISDHSCQHLGLVPGTFLYAQIKTAALLY